MYRNEVIVRNSKEDKVAKGEIVSLMDGKWFSLGTISVFTLTSETFVKLKLVQVCNGDAELYMAVKGENTLGKFQ